MNKHLGKIVFIITLLCTAIFGANVDIKLSSPAIYKGDSVTFTIDATGNDIVFPTISDIDGFSVQRSGTGSTTSIINGNVTKTLSASYRFAPTKDVTIPSFKVKIDGKEYTTKPQKVSVLKPQQGKSGDPFLLELKVDKKSLKVGQSTKLTLLFKKRFNVKVDQLRVAEPKIDNFWVKKIGKPKQYTQGSYVVVEYDYLIFAQKPGTFHIAPIEADIGVATQSSFGNGFFNDPFFQSMTTQMQWKKIYSNGLDITVTKLPNNLELYGDFKIDASVDKTEVAANKPVNLTINIEGSGNLDDIPDFNIDIPDAIVYPDKAQVSTRFVNGEYRGVFRQKIAIISDKDFIIKPLKLTYYDKLTNRVKTIQTKPIAIKVKGAKVLAKAAAPTLQKEAAAIKHTVTAKKEVVVQKEKSSIKYLFLLVGFILGALSSYIAMRLIKSKRAKRENDIIKLIKNTKDDKKLFEILLPYANESDVVADTLQKLEENIYKGAKHTIQKQKLYDYFFDRG